VILALPRHNSNLLRQTVQLIHQPIYLPVRGRDLTLEDGLGGLAVQVLK
jgi:hypothetical protein